MLNPNDLILIGLKHRVAAIRKSDGRELWCTDLPRPNVGAGGRFVTLTCDDSRAFAYSSGHLFCLNLADGRVLWTNGLKGYGYGIASVCVPGFGSAPDPAMIEKVTRDAAATAAAASH